jgi:RNA polymerase sigma-70 factor (ECF subfamily)
VAAAQGGDRQALDRLLRRHYDRLYALCRRLTGNDADAADAAQDALIGIVRGLPRFDGRAAFSTWSYRIAANACFDELRRRGRRPVLAFPTEDGDVALGASAERSPDTAVADRVTIDAALARLPEDFRVAVVLRDLCDLDYAEISHALAIPAGTVRSRIARGRAALAGLLGGNPSPTLERPSSQP